MASIIDIEGIGPKYAQSLTAAGVRTTQGLLKAAGNASGRKALADSTKIDAGKLLEWVNRADLMRLKGVGSEFSDLLEAAGVDSVKELARRRPDNLAAKMAEVNTARKLVRRVPSEKLLEGWIKEAGSLPQAVTH